MSMRLLLQLWLCHVLLATLSPGKVLRNPRNHTRSRATKLAAKPPRKPPKPKKNKNACQDCKGTVPCPGRYKQMFLWDAVNDANASSWFEFQSLNEFTTEEEKEELQRAERIEQRRIFQLEKKSLANHLESMSSRGIEHNMKVDDFNFEHSMINTSLLDELFDAENCRKKDRGMAVFSNARITPKGVIMNDASVCEAVRNGGMNASGPEFVSWLSFQGKPVKAESRYESVITLANMAEGSWHFPMELFVALANVDPEVLSRSKIHLKSFGKAMNWLSIVGYNKSNVIDGINKGTIFAKKVYAPKMARYGNPYTSQMYWLRSLVQSRRNISLSSYRDSKRSIVLIQRRDVRALRNFELIERTLKTLSSFLNYDFILHREYKDFNEQFKRFANAAVVVAPHGAAEMFINFAPPDLCLVEVISEKEPLCYARLAYLRGQDYIGVERRPVSPRTADLAKLSNAIGKCVLRDANNRTDFVKKVVNILSYLGGKKSIQLPYYNVTSNGPSVGSVLNHSSH